MIKVVTHAHLGPIRYHSEPSNFLYFLNQFLTLDFFLPLFTARLLQVLLEYSNNLINFISGELRTHPMGIDSSIPCFAAFHNVNCPKGFIYFNRKGVLRICVLPTHLSYDAPWPVRKYIQDYFLILSCSFVNPNYFFQFNWSKLSLFE